MAGSGPAVVLVHGLSGSSTTWRESMPVLARHHTVIAPDLLGHGDSAKPRGDYSLGAHASGVRDLMVALGVKRASIVGHSLGGGVAMQFAYQYPQRCERLVLVSSGGLGREVSPLLRVVSLPGSEVVMPLLLSSHLHRIVSAIGRVLLRFGLTLTESQRESWRSYTGLSEIGGRMAFIHTVRSVIDPLGQRVSALDRLYLAAEIPTLIIWGTDDRVIPADHGYTAHQLMPGSRLAVVEGAGHFLPFEAPTEFLDALLPFLRETKPAHPTEERFHEMLVSHSAEMSRGAGSGTEGTSPRSA
jgi:pimeloyl-ACP methyl ester carboxylesterase